MEFFFSADKGEREREREIWFCFVATDDCCPQPHETFCRVRPAAAAAVVLARQSFRGSRESLEIHKGSLLCFGKRLYIYLGIEK